MFFRFLRSPRPPLRPLAFSSIHRKVQPSTIWNPSRYFRTFEGLSVRFVCCVAPFQGSRPRVSCRRENASLCRRGNNLWLELCNSCEASVMEWISKVSRHIFFYAFFFATFDALTRVKCMKSRSAWTIHELGIGLKPLRFRIWEIEMTNSFGIIDI